MENERKKRNKDDKISENTIEITDNHWRKDSYIVIEVYISHASITTWEYFSHQPVAAAIVLPKFILV